MNALIAYFARQHLFGNLLTVFVLIVGGASVLLIQREVFPNVSFDVISVNTIFPAASPEEVEKLITNPIEQDLQEVDGIKKLRSTSVEGRSYIIAQLDPDQTTEAKGKSDIQDIIDRWERPEGVDNPIVTSIESKQQPIIEVSIAADINELDLRTTAKWLERELESVHGVAKVVHRGLRDREIRVEINPRKLAQYRIAIDDVVSALKRQNVSIPAGTLEIAPRPGLPHGAKKIVRTIGEFKNPQDVLDTVIRANDLGSPLRVKDVATAFYKLEKADLINRTNALPSLSLTVLKKEKADAIKVVDDVKAKMAALAPRLEREKIQVSFINDFSMYIRRRVSILTSNLFVGLILVFGMLALVLQVRVAALVSLGIPFSFLGAMIIFNSMGYTINLISMLGLIIVCGMLVDDAVVVTDNAVRLTEKGMDPEEAAIKGTQQIWPAVTASVLTTIVAFLPMLFMSGIFGKFVRQIPLGVISALLMSLFEAFFILPQHYATFVGAAVKAKVASRKAQKEAPETAPRIDRVLDGISGYFIPRYEKWLATSIRWRYGIAAFATVLFFGSLLLATKGMRFVLFPPDGVEVFFVRVQTPSGGGLETTLDIVRPIEKVVASLPRLEMDDFVTTVGVQQQDANDPNTKRGSEYAQIAVYLTPETSRDRTAAEIIEDLRNKLGKPVGVERLTFDRVNPGPPVGKAISIGVRAKEYSEILPAVAALKKKMATLNGVTDITDSYVAGKDELQVIVNKSEAAAAGLSAAQIGNTVRGAFDGIVASTIQELDDEVDIRVAFPDQHRSGEETLSQILIPNTLGNLVPLDRVAGVRQGKGLSAYEHEANQREVRVTADVDLRVTSATEANNAIRVLASELEKEYPGARFYFGGEDEDTAESLRSLFRAFAVAAFGIFMILVLTFKQLLQPVLVLLTIPMGIIAVIWTFFLHGLPLSFMGMLGIVALAGVIVNNAIVFVDFVNQARAEGVGLNESILQAARMRVRPIVLTTVTTVAGLLPTAYGIGGLDKFVVPIAMSLGWGLLLGSLMVALLFPSAIAILDDFNALLARVFRRAN
jgi:multidrug efflux pump subunit AcrB